MQPSIDATSADSLPAPSLRAEGGSTGPGEKNLKPRQISMVASSSVRIARAKAPALLPGLTVASNGPQGEASRVLAPSFL
jgi:hypothetical protein